MHRDRNRELKEGEARENGIASRRGTAGTETRNENGQEKNRTGARGKAEDGDKWCGAYKVKYETRKRSEARWERVAL